jgi:uracil-DNA glycosylase family 4
MVVGEAPGYQEAQRGRPFAGPSGQLIKSVLKNYKYKPSEVGFTNACLCRPPGNATPPKKAVACCRERLMGEIRDSGASSVLALGGTAATVLLDDNRGITNLRVGPPKEPTDALAGSKVARVVPTWHPAYCLRSADNFPALVTDVGKLQESTRPPWEPPTFDVVDDEEDALIAIRQLRMWATTLVVDIETGLDKDVSFDHPNNYDLLCIGLGYAKGKVLVVGEEACKSPVVLEQLKLLLQGVKIIAHNGKFDLSGLFPTLGALTLWFDTMLAHYSLDERSGAPIHGLKVLAIEELGAPAYGEEIATYVSGGRSYANIPRPLLYRYNAYDVGCTWDLYEVFSVRMDRDDVRRVHDHMVRASNELMYLELNGITVDRSYAAVLQSDYQTRLAEIESTLSRITEAPTFNPRSPKQVKEFLHSQGIVTVSTDKDHLDLIRRRVLASSTAGQFINTLLDYRYEQKRYSTYVVGIHKRLYRGRVYCTYMLHGTTSGRLSSRNPNLQNIVRDRPIRRQFVPASPDNIFMQCDYKNVEARVMTVMAQDEYLRKLLSNPDPNYKFFNELSDELYGAGKWDKEDYVRTKAFFYGIGYGREPYSIAMEFNMSVQEATRRYNDFVGLIPGIVKWQQETRRKVLAGEDLVTSFGRKRRFHLITEQNQKDVLNEALSHLPQSTASDICLSSLIRLRPMLRGIGWIRLTLHDALVVETPKRNLEVCRDMMRTVMEEEGSKYSTFVPFPVDFTTGDNWGAL